MGKKIKPFDWMRRTRNEAEYPQAGSASLHEDDIDDALAIAHDIIELSGRLIETLPPYGR